MVNVTQITDRLTQLGYSPTQHELPQIEFELGLIISYVVNYCNFRSPTEIPYILEYRIIDRVCAEYLSKRKNAGLLEGFDYSAVVKNIKEGDTQLQFGTENDGETPETRFNKMVDSLTRGFDKWCAKHRKLSW